MNNNFLSKNTKSLKRKTNIILMILTAVVLLIVIAGFILFKTYHIYETKVVAADCEKQGYTESVCIFCKEIKRTDFTPALGHEWGKIIEKTKPTKLDFGEASQTCLRCKKEITTKIDPTSKMKKFYFSGDPFDVDNSRTASGMITYSYNGNSETKYVKLKYDDKSTSKYIKHDYTVKFFEDDHFSQNSKIKLMDGVPANSEWGIYGNYYDIYNLRDTVTTELFCQARKSSKSIDKRLKDNYATSKTEPVLFYINDTFVGVFRLIEPVGTTTMNVKKNSEKCAVVRAKTTNEQSCFKSQTKKGGAWEVKYNYTDDDTWVYDSLNELIKFVSEKEGKEFKKGISQYLDVDGMIDYMLTVYLTGAADNVSRALTLATYDGKVWTPSVYDINLSLGMNNRGEITNLETILSPSKSSEGIESDTNSVLWQKMLENFYGKFKKRYKTLIKKVFTADNIYKKFEKHFNEIPKIALEKEKEVYTAVDTTTDLKQSLKEFIAARKSVFDIFFE